MEHRNPKELTPHPTSIALYGDNHIDDIKESIAKLGILVPLTINDKNIVISGHRRWRCAIELAIDSVPVEVKTFANELEEKQSILEFNQQRQKTTMQTYNELKLRKEIRGKIAQENVLAGKSIDPAPENGQGDRHKRSTDEIIGREMQIGGREKVRQLEKICESVENGVPEAKELIEKIDKKDTTIGKAYSDLFDKAHVSHNTGENEWYTPKMYLDAARQVMGIIDLDPASSNNANKLVQAIKYFTSNEDGRKQLWHGNVWMNPPYSQPLVSEFCDLLVKMYKEKHINQACVLVNNATETNFYQNMLANCSAVCFIKGRIKFIDEEGTASGAPLQGQTILYFGANRDIFTQQFSKFGVILYAV